MLKVGLVMKVGLLFMVEIVLFYVVRLLKCGFFCYVDNGYLLVRKINEI